MISVFTGDDRVRAKSEITKFLGSDYEVIDGVDVDVADLPSIFLGTSLLATDRHILIRDLSTNKPAFDELPKYLHTPHRVALFETKLDKRSATYKALKASIEIKEFALPAQNIGQIFDIYRTAKTNGKKAISMLSDLKMSEDPIKFTGLLVSQALKDFSSRPGVKEKRILKELAAADLQMKTTSIDPWLIVESFLLRLSSI